MSCKIYPTVEIHNETNGRIFDRNIPSSMLQPYISVRPVMTKYSILPIVDPRKELSVKLPVQPTYNISQTFNPGNNTAPWSGYASEVNKESELRNQFFALQRCSQSVYVPNSKSDLYDYQFRPLKQTIQPFPELFVKDQFSDFNPNPENIPQNIFNTPTRVSTMNYYDKRGVKEGCDNFVNQNINQQNKMKPVSK